MTLKSVGIEDYRPIEYLRRPLRQWPATSFLHDESV